MQPHTEARVGAGDGHCFVEGRAADHEAGRGEDALAMRPEYGGVDLGRGAEVVGVDDQAARRTHSVP
jgi:hypothetical protein